MISIIVGGLIALDRGVLLEAFPPWDVDTISISVPLRAASPEDVELGIAVRIEEAIKDIEGIDRMVSRSREGSTRVTVEVDPDYDPRDLLDKVKSRVDAINTFPVDAEKPVIALADRRFAVINVVISGTHSEDEIRRLARAFGKDVI